MKHINGFLRGLTILMVLGTACMGLASVCLAHGDDGQENSRILPPNSRVFGLSYAEWSAKWWQWAIAMPTTAHPLFETADCNAGQSGRVWFLGGSFVNSTATRSCTVPSGMPVFLPILNAECSTVEPDPFHGNNAAELSACAKGFMDNTAGLFASIDGRDVQDVGNAGRFRVQSPLFSFSAPDNNVLFVPGPVSGQSVSDGVWLMLAPLSVGHHTLHFGGVFNFPGFSLAIDQVYNLTVLRRGRGRGDIDSEAGDVQQGTWGMVKELYRR